MKYVCTACGYVYDEEVEGVKFEDLPEDWTCPLCGVGKDLFEKVEVDLGQVFRHIFLHFFIKIMLFFHSIIFLFHSV